MKFLRLFLLILVCTAFSSAQRPDCPKIEIIGPSGVTNPGETLTVNVEVNPPTPDLKYFWQVTHGKIEIGQATQSIVVRGSMGDDAGEDMLPQ
jgi:hypothetical protein